MFQDLRYACRALVRNRAYASATILTLALPALMIALAVAAGLAPTHRAASVDPAIMLPEGVTAGNGRPVHGQWRRA
jgi:hypothetical protein